MATTPEQQRESAEFVKQFTRVGVAMAEESLRTLESRLESEINQTKLDNLTTNEYNQVIVVAQKFGPLLRDEPAIDALTINAYKNDFLFVATFFNDPLKTDIITMVNAIDDAQFVIVKENFRTSAALVRAQEAESAQEHLAMVPNRLNNEQRNLFRNVPDIGSLVEQVSAEMEARGESMQSEAARERIIELVTQKAYEELVRIYEGNMQVISEVKRQQSQENLNDQINQQLGVRVEGRLGANNVVEHFGNAQRFLFGAGGYEDIEHNKLITAVLSPQARREFNQLFISAAASDGHGINIPNGIQELVETNVRRIMDGPEGQDMKADFSDVAAHFHKLYTEEGSHNPERVKRDRDIMVKKLKTVPAHWQNTPEAQKYEDYVLANGVDAYDFNGALDRGYLGKVSMIRKLIMMFKALWSSIKGAFTDGEDLEEWERIQHYKDPVEALAGGDGKEPPTDAELASGRGIFARLSELTVAEFGPGSFRISKNGAEMTVGSVEDAADVEKLEFVSNQLDFENHPDRLGLLRRGIELDDLYALAENIGDGSSDKGFNVEFVEGGFELSYDIENLISKNAGEMLGGGAGALGALTVILVGATTWPVTLIAVLVASGALVGSGIGALDNRLFDGIEKFDYEDLSPQRLHAAIEEIKADVGLIEEAFANVTSEQVAQYAEGFENHADKFDMTKITKFPSKLFSENGFSAGFQSFLDNVPAAAWDRPLEQADLDLFAKALDWGGRVGFNSIDNADDAFYPSKGGSMFGVEGSGLKFVGAIDPIRVSEEDYRSISSFFDDLRADGELNDGDTGLLPFM